jgi:hypothetical protein
VKRVQESPWIVPDETGWRIGGHMAWLHVAVGIDAVMHYVVLRLVLNWIGSRSQAVRIEERPSSRGNQPIRIFTSRRSFLSSLHFGNLCGGRECLNSIPRWVHALRLHQIANN